MKHMNGGMPKRRSSGFTIIEVMIVLAISGALLTTAFLLVNGKQNVTSFNQSIRDVQTHMQQIVNEVGSGYYVNDDSIKCTKVGGLPSLTSATTVEGTNLDCIFLGKVVQFGIPNTDPQQFNIYTVVGLRADTSLDLATAKARVIASSNSGSDANVPNIFDTGKLLYGLTVSKMYYNGNTANTIGAVGLTSSLGDIGAADGSQHVNVVAIKNTTLNVDKSTGVGQIDSNLASAVVNPTGGVQVCFNSGGTNNSGLLSIGGAGRQGNIDMQIFNNPDCT